jgi:TolA-binding protein
VKVRGLLLLALCVAVAGCGGSSDATGPPTKQVRGVSQAERQCQGTKAAAKRELQRRKLNADLRNLRLAAATVKGFTQNGNAAINKAVDRFELDVAEESIRVQERSRFIDRAAAIVGPRCYLCFQALEANRPLAAGSKLACG